MQTGEGVEELEEHLMDLDATFRFKCQKCGKCRKNQDMILFTPSDIFKIAKKLRKPIQAIINNCMEVYVGPQSKIPLVHLLMTGPKNACPFLGADSRCSIHDCKPVIIIHSVIYLNSGRILRNGKTPAQLWTEAAPKLLEPPMDELRLMALPRENVKLARKGFRINAIWYAPDSMDGLYLGDTYTLAYDQSNLSCVYLVTDREFRCCPAAPGQGACGVSQAEFDSLKHKQIATCRAARKQQIQASTESLRKIQESFVEGRWL